MRKVLVVGKGGREHALARKFAQSAKVYVAPGNAGMKDVATLVPIDENDFQALADFALSEKIDLTVIGPESLLEQNIAGFFKNAGLKVWGPDAEAAAIETSKSFAKDLMKKYKIPTAAYEVFTDYTAACEYVKNCKLPIVIKADGLAAGKGVVITESRDVAVETLNEMMIKGGLGEANRQVVIEEYMEGEEFSLIAFVANDRVYPMELAQDHKRAHDNDKGPNTGGMGAYSPVPQIGADVIKRAMDEIMLPAARAMVKENMPFFGFLFGGLISTREGPKVIEFNARFGDPEAEVILPRLESDLYDVIMTLLDGGEPRLKWSGDAVVGVVLASKGYPGKFKIGHKIDRLDSLDKNTMIFHCGTGEGGVTAGGRVLLAARKAADIETAQREVYEEIKKIRCENLFYRTDIGNRGKTCKS